MNENKWVYINKIRNYKENSESLLSDLLDTYKKYGLRDITYEEAKEFWNELIKREGENL